MTKTYPVPATPKKLDAERSAARSDAAVLRLRVEIDNLVHYSGRLRRGAHDSLLRSRTMGADMLLGGVEVHLANAAAHLRLAHDLLAGRGAYKGGK